MLDEDGGQRQVAMDYVILMKITVGGGGGGGGGGWWGCISKITTTLTKINKLYSRICAV